MSLLLVLLAFFYTACNNSTGRTGPVGPSIPVPSAAVISVKPAAASLAKGGTLTFTATGGSGVYTWSVDNALGTIDAAKGILTAGNTSGTVNVTATDSRGATGTATVNISGSPVIILPTSAIISVGATQTFTATTGTAPFFWTSSNVAVGTIGTATGIFQAKTAGASTITALDSQGNMGIAMIQVLSVSIAVSPKTATVTKLPAGGVGPTFTATGNVGTVSFALSGATNNYSGASINSTTGAVTISAMPNVAQGQQTLTVTASDGSATPGTATLVLSVPQIVVTPGAIAISTLPAAPTFTATGNLAAVTFTLTGATGGYTGATINSTTGAVSIAALPLSIQGSQTFTITATDGVAVPGTATLTVSAQAPASLSPAFTTLSSFPAGGAGPTYTPSGFGGTVTYAMTGGFPGATIGSTTGAVTITAMPTQAQRSQTLTIIGTFGTQTAQATLLLNPVVPTVTPASTAISTLAQASGLTYSASGFSGTVTFTLSGTTGGYTGATINSSTGAVTVTALPSAALGQASQTLTIFATDGTSSAAATLTIVAGP